MRPDKADMILLPRAFVWRGLAVDVAVAVGARPKIKALDWLKTFSFEKKRLLLFQEDDAWVAFGPAAFQADMIDRLSRGEKPWML